MKKLIIYILVLAIIIGLGIAVGLNIKDDNKPVPTTSGNVENKTENKVENNVENKEENTIQNEISNNEIENKTEDEAQEEGPADKAGEPKTDLEIAIDIAKKEWGTDDGVKFELEQKESDKVYIICVREFSSTDALAWYKIDIEAETCEEW